MKVLLLSLFFCCLLSIGLAAPGKEEKPSKETKPVKEATTVKEAIDKEWNKLKALMPLPVDPLKLNAVNQTWCTCGVFLSGQFKKGETPKGNAALLHEQDSMYPCTPMGSKQCTNKCLETIAKHLPNSPAILCGSIDRDVFRERAYLFIQSCNGTWLNTNLSAGREFCCKDGAPYKCPNNLI